MKPAGHYMSCRAVTSPPSTKNLSRQREENALDYEVRPLEMVSTQADVLNL